MSAAGTVQECRSFYAQRLKFAEPERMALDPIVSEIRRHVKPATADDRETDTGECALKILGSKTGELIDDCVIERLKNY
jgi:hypothetical protein